MANMLISAMTDLWNNVGTVYTAIKMNVTNSASHASSKLIDLQVGGSSKFSVSPAGAVVATGSISTTGALLPTVDDGAALGSTTFRWSDLYGATGFTLNLAAGDWVGTHSTGVFTVSTGDLRVTIAGTNAASVVTVGGTQTLTGKTLTSPTINSPALATPSLTDMTISGTANTAASATWTNLGTVTTVDINGGTVDGATIGASVRGSGAFTTLGANSTVTFSAGGSMTGTWTSLGTVTTIDINGGTVDGAVIGGASAAAGTFTTLTASTLIDLTAGRVKFPVAQNASSDPNTLDDYEEGAFTPVIIGTSTAGAGTYSGQQGKYVKIGSVVFFSLRVSWTAHTGTADMRVGGFPFAASSGVATVASIISTDITFSGTLGFGVTASQTYGDVVSFETGVGALAVPMDTAGTFNICGIYFV